MRAPSGALHLVKGPHIIHMTNKQRSQVRAIVASETKGVIDAHFTNYMYDVLGATGGDDNVLFETVKLMIKTQAITISFERFKEEGLSVESINRDKYLTGQLMAMMDKMVAEKWEAYYIEKRAPKMEGVWIAQEAK